MLILKKYKFGAVKNFLRKTESTESKVTKTQFQKLPVLQKRKNKAKTDQNDYL